MLKKRKKEREMNHFMTVLNVIGLLFACVFVIYIVYEGWDLPLAILIGAVIICITNGMNVVSTMGAMLEDIKFLFGIMLLPFLFGSILAKVLIDSRGALSTAVKLLDLLGKNRSEQFRRRLAVGITVIILAALGYCSFNNAFLQGAIAIAMCSATNVPRKYMIAICMFSTTLSVLLPGNVGNAMYTSAYMPEVSAFSALPVAIIISLFFAIIGYLLINKNIERSIAAGDKWEYGPLANPNIDSSDKMPPWFLLLVPIIGIFIPYAILKLDIWVSIAIGLIAALIVYFPYLPYGKEAETLNSFKKGTARIKLVTSAGIAMAGMPILMVMNNGLATAISMSNGFAVVESFFRTLPFHPLVNLSLIGTILTGIASGPAGFLLGLNVAVESYVPMGISAEACRYLLICTFTILDTLPTSMGFLMLTSWAGVKVKDAYPCVFKSTVILPAIATVICLILFMLFPGLAMVGA